MEKNNSKTDKELLLEGKWLTKNELKILYERLLSTLSVTDPSKYTSKRQAREYQRQLFTLCMFALGGQRLELILAFTTENLTHSLEEDYLLKPPREKIIRANCFGGIPVPSYLGRLLFFFKDHIRSLLLVRDSVISYWINRKGNPMEGGTVRTLLHITANEHL